MYYQNNFDVNNWEKYDFFFWDVFLFSIVSHCCLVDFANIDQVDPFKNSLH